MGFGILFFGYCITYIMALNPYGVLFRLFGYVLVVLGCKKLGEYEPRFKRAGLLGVSLLVLTVVQVVSFAFDYAYENLLIANDLFPTVIDDVIFYVNLALVCSFHIFLLLAIRYIARDTESDKIQSAAVRNLFFVCMYYFMVLLAYVPSPIQEPYSKYLALPLFMLNIVWLILNVILLFSCYAKICDESDVEMEQKPSRFEFVNNYRREMEERRRIADEKYAKKQQEKKNKKK